MAEQVQKPGLFPRGTTCAVARRRRLEWQSSSLWAVPTTSTQVRGFYLVGGSSSESRAGAQGSHRNRLRQSARSPFSAPHERPCGKVYTRALLLLLTGGIQSLPAAGKINLPAAWQGRARKCHLCEEQCRSRAPLAAMTGCDACSSYNGTPCGYLYHLHVGHNPVVF